MERAGQAIPRDRAVELCDGILKRNRSRWYTFNGLWCWGCAAFTGGDPTKRCWSGRQDNRGCSQVNREFDRAPG